MAKLKLLNTKDITAEMFDCERSFMAGMFAINVCNKIIERANAGNIVFHFEQLVRPEFELRWKGDKFLGLYLKDFENAWVQIVGDCTNNGKISCRKYDVRDFFKLWRVAEITNVYKVSDLTR